MAVKLRPYQEKIKADVYQAWRDGHKNVLLVMPTGMGKTKTFCSVTIDLMKSHPTAIMVHRTELVLQICLTLAEEGIAHNIIAPRPVIQEIIKGERRMFNRQFYDYNAGVTVISVDTLNARIEKHRKWADTIKLWITDEAAHVLRDNKWGRAASYFKNAIGLGVTATPQRLDKRGLGTEADGIFDVMVIGPTSRWGIDQGFLSNYRIAIPESDYNQYLRAANSGSDYSHEAMVHASMKSHIVGDVVKSYSKHALGKQAILFADSIITAERMEKEFAAAGITAKLLTGETSASERLQTLIKYRDRAIQVLINVDLFDEGLDVPGIEVVIMARPTKSLGKFLQQVGRGLRPAKGKEYLILIDHVGNVAEHGLPDQYRRWTLDRMARRHRDKINFIRICLNPACNMVYDRLLHVCPYCGIEDQPATRGSRDGKSPLEQVDGDLVLLDPEVLRQLESKTVLEDPGRVGERVSRAAGAAAGNKAMEQQKERIRTQNELKETVAKWAGKLRGNYYSDRMIHKKFYMHFEMTITEALALPRAEMQEIREDLENGYVW